jgi:hypothetical protein
MQSFCATLYCHLWPVWLYQVSARYRTNGTDFGKKIVEQEMCVLIFSATFV